MAPTPKKVYLTGQPNEYEDNWKELLKEVPGFEFYDWEFDSDQTSPETFFVDDLKAVGNADILIANPGVAPSEATWMEIGSFYMKNTAPGDFCERLIIIWKDDRNSKWSIDFVKKVGKVVSSVEEAITELEKLK